LGADEEAPLDECLAAGLLQLDGQMLSFRHELARQAVEGALSPARRQALNTHVLHALLESEVAPAAPARLAHHAIQTEDAALVLRFTPEAARQAAARGARREAIAHYQTALRYTAQLAPEQQAGLLDEVSYELSLTGHIADAVQTCEAALAIWRALDQRERVGHGLRHLASLNSYLARNAEAERHGVAAIALLETLSPGRELASAYATLSRLRMVTSDTAQTIVWGERAIALAEQLADHETVSAALTSMGSSELCAGDEGGRAKLERSLAIALEHGFEQQVGLAYFNLTQICVTHRAFAQAEIYLQAGMAYCGEHELDIASQRLRADLAHLRLSQGDWAGADEQVSSILRLPVLSTGNRIRPLTVLGLVRARRGDPGAETVLDELRDLALATGELICIAPMAAARAEWRWLRGDHAGCAAEAQVGVQAAAHRHRPWYLGEVAIWLWRGGGAGTALDELDDLDEVALPFALEMAGDWRGAADRWAQLGCPYEQALALLDGDEAAQREALTIFERLGARPAAEITRQRLRQAGARGLPRGPRPATRANPLGLTPRQLEILLLVATGLRNGEIAERLSTTSKTVEHHLTDILAKLNARSRLEAVSIAAASGLLPPRVTTPSRP
jgi:DNA-binding CsgD family transcriptional regulator